MTDTTTEKGEIFARGELVAVFALGVIALAFTGVQPVLAGALADLHRLSAANIGFSATLEALSVAASTTLAGLILTADRLKLVAIVGCAGSLLANLATLHTADTAFLVARVAAGIPEGLLLWIPVGLIARTVSPERWSAAFFTALTVIQLFIAGAFAFFVLPRFGADGGFATLALLGASGLTFLPLLPQRFSELPKSSGVDIALPLRGWVALLALLVYSAAGSAVPPYLQPLAHQAGLDAGVARTALWVSLLVQILGGVIATAFADRVRYLIVFALCTVGFLTTYAVFAGHAGSWAFIAAYGATGLFSIFVSAFTVPLTIDADPSRKTAVTSAGVQILAIALGPLLGAIAVTDTNTHGVLWLAGACRIVGLMLVAGLFLSIKSRR